MNDEILNELRGIRIALERAFPTPPESYEAKNEIRTKEALKMMHVNTVASLTRLVKFFPSIRVRRGVYDREKLRYALKAREQLANSR